MQADIAIVGGGPAGLSAAHAILVARPNLKVAVLERSDLRPRGATFGLAANGVRAMEAISPALKKALAGHHFDNPQYRRFKPSGDLVAASDNGEQSSKLREYGEMIYLPWHTLQRELAEALPPGVLHTHHRFLHYTETPDGVVAEFATPEGVVQVAAQLLVGCDGGQSGVREQLVGDGPPNYLGMAIWRAIRPRPADWPLERGSISWGGPGQATLLTNTLSKDSIVWQAFAPWPADQLQAIGGGRKAYVQDADASQLSDTPGQTLEQVGAERLARALSCFQGHPQIVKDVIAATDPTTVTEHGQFSREADQCQTYAVGRVALTGDAAHLATPFLGQGCSQAVEDALELGRAVGVHGPTPQALAAYQEVRLPLSSAVQAASVQLCKDFNSGKMDKHEYDVNIEEGFVKRTFQPLKAPIAPGKSS